MFVCRKLLRRQSCHFQAAHQLWTKPSKRSAAEQEDSDGPAGGGEERCGSRTVADRMDGEIGRAWVSEGRG